VACGCNRGVNYSVCSFVALTPLRESAKRPDAEPGLLNKSLADTQAHKLNLVPLRGAVRVLLRKPVDKLKLVLPKKRHKLHESGV
jgi:hypothetical protein